MAFAIGRAVSVARTSRVTPGRDHRAGGERGQASHPAARRLHAVESRQAEDAFRAQPWHNPRRYLGLRLLDDRTDRGPPRLLPPLTNAQVDQLHPPEAPCGQPGVYSVASPRLSTCATDGESPRCDGRDASPILILPGFGNAAEDYAEMVQSLRERGFRCHVAPVKRADWLRIFRHGLISREFWAGRANVEIAYGWYLALCEEALALALADANTGASGSRCSGKVAIVGHSAGGWLGRALAAKCGAMKIDSVVTLGSPLFPTPPPGRDMTGGALTSVADELSESLPDGIRSICVAGRAVVGAEIPQAEGTDKWRTRAATAYREVCCTVGVAGDGTVPTHYALLGPHSGAENIVLDGVFHSVNTPTVWYGSEEVIDIWASRLC